MACEDPEPDDTVWRGGYEGRQRAHVEEHHGLHGLPGGLELARHLRREDTADAVPTEAVPGDRTETLELPQVQKHSIRTILNSLKHHT